MNVKQLIPKEGKAIIRRALKLYQQSLDGFDQHYDYFENTKFDIIGLLGMMEYDVEIALPKSVKDTFASKHGVDFPKYTEDIEREYPIFEKPKDEWLTVIVGTISFTDDGTHERSASIQEIISIDKYLKGGESEDALDNLEESGQDYLVVEEYDGAIEIDIIITPKPKDKRVFQVVDASNSTTYPQSFTEVMDGVDSGYRDLIDALGAGEVAEIHKSEVYIIRIK